MENLQVQVFPKSFLLNVFFQWYKLSFCRYNEPLSMVYRFVKIKSKRHKGENEKWSQLASIDKIALMKKYK
jgi:hypothetical protein